MIKVTQLQTWSKMLTQPRQINRVLGQFEKTYPFASRIMSREEIIRGGIMTRFLVGTTRVYINRPSDSKKVELTRSQKYQSFFERFFVEIIGIPLQILTMFSTQEVVSRLFKASGFANIPTIKQISKEALKIEQETGINRLFNQQHLNAIKSAMHQEMKREVSPIALKIYSPDKLRTHLQKVPLTMLSYVKGSSAPKSPINPLHLKTLADRVTESYLSRLRVGSALTQVGGILAGAMVGGYFIQWMNDNIFSTKVIPKLLQSLGIVSKQTGRTVYVKSHIPSIKERTFVM